MSKLEINPTIQALVDKNKLSNEDAITLEIFFANSNLDNKQREFMINLLDKVACS